MGNSNSLSRLENISTFGLSLIEKKEELKLFVELAKNVTESQTSQINVIDGYCQWTIAGPDKLLLKEESICYDTIRRDGMYEVTNLENHEKYKDRSWVQEKRWLKHYCGTQLVSSEEQNIGSICVFDTEPKTLTDAQKLGLEQLSNMVVEKLEADKKLVEANSRVLELKDKFHKFNHDIRSPINGILGMAEMLNQDLQKEDVSTKNLQLITDCAETVIEEVDKVLEHIDKWDDQESHNTESNLHNVFKRVERLYQPHAQAKEITLDVEIGDHQAISEVHEQAQKIAQIAGNLVANSIKFTSRGGCVAVELQVVENELPNRLILTVEDSGEGMTADQVAAFNKGEEVSGTAGTEGEPSFGIGLKHVKELVAEVGGTIQVSAKKGEGTRFSMSLAPNSG
jgi:signal transduction histidine kinase